MTVDDQATVVEERDRELALARRMPEGPLPIGVCLNCEERVADGLRWCDATCRDDWERARKGPAA